MANTPTIADHGLIGDLQTAALVSTDGSIDWLCLPRFDSPSVFASLVDHERGGYCQVRPTNDNYAVRQLYLPDTAVLVTRFMTDEGVAEVIDFMPVSNEARSSASHRLVRILRVVRGQMSLTMEIAPSFDYGRAQHTLELSEDGAVFRAGDAQATVHLAGLLADRITVEHRDHGKIAHQRARQR